jgi:membrane protein
MQEAAEPTEPAASADRSFADRARGTTTSVVETTRRAGDRHVSIAVPLRAVERNRRVAASVLAGGIAYRIFLWLVPFGLVVGGALGLGDAAGIEDALSHGGIPGAVVNAIGDIAGAADANSWLLLLAGVPTLLWEGYSGTKALQLTHSLVWNDPPPRPRPLQSSLAFSGVMCAFIAAVSITWWFRDVSTATQVVVFAVTIVPLAALWLAVSLRLPHGAATWKALLPGALLVAVGFQMSHAIVVYLLAPRLESTTSVYAALGSVTTLLFFMYIAGRIVVTAPILNSSLHTELRGTGRTDEATDEIELRQTGTG